MTFLHFKKYCTVIALFSILIGARGYAQEAGPLFFLPGISQSSLLNPATQNKTDKLVLGLPVISGIQFGLNSSFPVNSIFSNDFRYYSFDKFHSALDEIGKASLSANISMFYASLKMNDWNYTFSISERAFATTTFDRDIVKLIRDGNRGYSGTNIDFGSGSFNFNHYRELAFGISKRVWKELDIGIRPKILFGRFYFDARDFNISIESDTGNRDLLVKPEGSFIFSAPLKYRYDPKIGYVNFSAEILPGNYFFNLRNLGLATDIGLNYRPNKQVELSASLLDLGFLGFKHNTFVIEFIEPIRYEEYQLYQSDNPKGKYYLEPREALKAFNDSLSYIVTAEKTSLRSIVKIPLKINFSAKFDFAKTMSAGVFNQYTINGEYTTNQLSGFIHASLKERAEFVTTLTLNDFSNVWLGFGGSYTAGFIQAYFSFYNISGIIDPPATKNLNLCIGINLLFATKKR